MSPKKLIDDDKQEILNLYRQTSETTSTLAHRYGVSSSTISRFLKNTLSDIEYEELIQQKRLARTNKIQNNNDTEKIKKSNLDTLKSFSESKKNNENNYIEGNIVTQNTENCYLKSEKRLIAAIGLKDLIIVETSDAILIADKNKSQEVKNIVEPI